MFSVVVLLPFHGLLCSSESHKAVTFKLKSNPARATGYVVYTREKYTFKNAAKTCATLKVKGGNFWSF